MKLVRTCTLCILAFCHFYIDSAIAQEATPPLPEADIIRSMKKVVEEANDGKQTTESILDKRTEGLKEANVNPFSISQYRQNYLLPVTYITSPNPLSVDGLTEENIDRFEAKYQISVNMPVFLKDDGASGVFFAMTLKSYWQVYNSESSKPFRENNYEPEVYYQWQTDWDVLGYRINRFDIGINHQSNGQNGLKSRSWNRIYATALFSDVNSLYYVKAWYRLPEEEKTFPLDPIGDDNPDITDFIGRAEFGYGFKWGKVEFLSKLTNNLSFDDNRGSIEVNVTYPINNRYDLLLQYFNGYGDSLIDYNRHQQRIGLGIQLKLL